MQIGKEIMLVLIIKVILLIALWWLFFSHPVKKMLDTEKVRKHYIVSAKVGMTNVMPVPPVVYPSEGWDQTGYSWHPENSRHPRESGDLVVYREDSRCHGNDVLSGFLPPQE